MLVFLAERVPLSTGAEGDDGDLVVFMDVNSTRRRVYGYVNAGVTVG
jgi:hypothetical protein